MFKRPMGLMVLVASLVMLMAACATTGTTTDENGNVVVVEKTIDKEKALALAKIVARKAGKYVALNNPEVAVSVKMAYALIENYEGSTFRDAFLDRLQTYLDANGIKGSAELRADASDILDLFGYDIDTTSIDAAFLERFDVENIKAVAMAFIQGMSLTVSAA